MEILNVLEEKIIDVLNEITPDINPTISNLISTRQGMKSIIKLIKDKVINDRMTIGEAINSISSEFDINGYSE
jgi:hypothetical protein